MDEEDVNSVRQREERERCRHRFGGRVEETVHGVETEAGAVRADCIDEEFGRPDRGIAVLDMNEHNIGVIEIAIGRAVTGVGVGQRVIPDEREAVVELNEENAFRFAA